MGPTGLVHGSACVTESNTSGVLADQEPEPSDEVLRSLMWAMTDALARDLVSPATTTAKPRRTEDQRRRGLGQSSRLPRRCLE